MIDVSPRPGPVRSSPSVPRSCARSASTARHAEPDHNRMAAAAASDADMSVAAITNDFGPAATLTFTGKTVFSRLVMLFGVPQDRKECAARRGRRWSASGLAADHTHAAISAYAEIEARVGKSLRRNPRACSRLFPGCGRYPGI